MSLPLFFCLAAQLDGINMALSPLSSLSFRAVMNRLVDTIAMLHATEYNTSYTIVTHQLGPNSFSAQTSPRLASETLFFSLLGSFGGAFFFSLALFFTLLSHPHDSSPRFAVSFLRSSYS